mmetsp:Transcript_1274/g.3858  ORF Transcript_1274/g.3858 Transcript_1274/m.3858 type:complete len:99 (+) Transcript_1274:276-572(+)
MFMLEASSSVGKHWLWFAQLRMVMQVRPERPSDSGSALTKVSQISVREQYQGPLQNSAAVRDDFPRPLCLDTSSRPDSNRRHSWSQYTRVVSYMSLPV